MTDQAEICKKYNRVFTFESTVYEFDGETYCALSDLEVAYRNAMGRDLGDPSETVRTSAGVRVCYN